MPTTTGPLAPDQIIASNDPGDDTARECMANIFSGLDHLPLAFPGSSTVPPDPITKGAVYSLIPDSLNPTGQPQFASLPNPNIPNATWFAIGSDWIDDNHLPASTLRVFWNTFIADTYPPSQNPMTISSMLGTRDNDVIVRLDSQLAGGGLERPIGEWRWTVLILQFRRYSFPTRPF